MIGRRVVARANPLLPVMVCPVWPLGGAFCTVPVFGPRRVVTKLMDKDKASTVDEAEIARFSALAGEWWNPKGKFRPLHQINPLRLGFIKEEACRRFGRDLRSTDTFRGLRILDIGCGGGLLSEPLARLGGHVIGADASATNIEVAKLHAGEAGLAVDYRATTAEALAEAGERFDMVLAMEIVEHVPDMADFVRICASMLKPGGGRQRRFSLRSSVRSTCFAGCRAARTNGRNSSRRTNSGPPISRATSRRGGCRGWSSTRCVPSGRCRPIRT